MNNIEQQIFEVNKDSSIYLSSFKLKPVFDTGFEDNYISIDLVNKLGLKVYEKEIKEKRYACLGHPFYIKEYLEIEFIHNERNYIEVFNILPGRRDHTILLGRTWLNKIINKKPQSKKSEDFQELKLKLFMRNQNGIKLDYDCLIN